MHISRDQIQLNTFSCPVSTYTLGKSKNVHVELNQFFLSIWLKLGRGKKAEKFLVTACVGAMVKWTKWYLIKKKQKWILFPLFNRENNLLNVYSDTKTNMNTYADCYLLVYCVLSYLIINHEAKMDVRIAIFLIITFRVV